jgi:hypothetical protein
VCDPRERFGGDENSAIIVMGALRVESRTRNVLDQFAISLENRAIATGKVCAIGMISQCLVAHPTRHRSPVFVHHQKTNAVLF